MQVLLTSVLTRGKANPTHWKLPERLRRERKRQRLGPVVLSKAAGAGENTITQIEAGARLPRLSLIERLASVLQVSPAYLAFGHDTPCEDAPDRRCLGMAARLHEVRTLRGLSMRDVARSAGCAPGTVRSTELGATPTVDTAEVLANALGVSPAWLAFGVGPRELSPRRRTSTDSFAAETA